MRASAVFLVTVNDGAFPTGVDGFSVSDDVTSPVGIAENANGNLLVMGTSNVLRAYDTDGNRVTADDVTLPALESTRAVLRAHRGRRQDIRVQARRRRLPRARDCRPRGRWSARSTWAARRLRGWPTHDTSGSDYRLWAARRTARQLRRVNLPGVGTSNSVTVTLPDSAYDAFATRVQWRPAVSPSLGTSISHTGQEILLDILQLFFTSGLVGVELKGPGSPDDFSDQMEQNGTITCVASDGETLVVTGINDSTDPYGWTPSNSAEVIAFANHIIGLSAGQRSLIVTFDDASDSFLATVLSTYTLDVGTVPTGVDKQGSDIYVVDDGNDQILTFNSADVEQGARTLESDNAAPEAVVRIGDDLDGRLHRRRRRVRAVGGRPPTH